MVVIVVTIHATKMALNRRRGSVRQGSFFTFNCFWKIFNLATASNVYSPNSG